MHTLTDQQIIKGLRAGDTETLKTAIAMYQKLVYNATLSLVKNEAEAEEISQDVFLTLWQRIGEFKGESKLSTWMYKIAVTKSLDLIRSKNRKKRFTNLTALVNEKNEILHDPAHWVHPGAIAEHRELSAYLFRAIDALPDNQRIAFTLSRVEHLSQKEVAEIMEINEGAVESLLQRAKINLKKSLSIIYEEIR